MTDWNHRATVPSRLSVLMAAAAVPILLASGTPGTVERYGALTVEPGGIVRMDETPTFVLTYTVGALGLNPESQVWIGIPTPFSRPQDQDPADYGYCEVSASRPEIRPSLVLPKERGWGFAGWGWAAEIRFAGAARAGDRVVLTYGKGKGVQLGHVAFASVFRLKLLHHVFLNDARVVAETEPVWLSGTEPVTLIVTAPSRAAAGQPLEVTVVPRDAMDNACLAYEGQVSVSSNASRAQLPPPARFSLADRGRRTFSVRFSRPGVYAVRARDERGLEGASNPIEVTEVAPPERLYWGELHIHTSYSDGLGTPDTAYRYGRDLADIDFMGVTDHAEMVGDEDWKRTQEAAKRHHEPGTFVTFLAQEWSAPTEFGGDHNVFHLDDDRPIYRSNQPNMRHVKDLYERIKRHRAFCLPHVGGRVANLDFHDPDVQRDIEIMSNHGIFEMHTNFALRRGYALGIVAASDGHDGNAGYSNWLRTEIRQHGGLAAVWAKSLTRDAVYEALYNRRVYATTGERILLKFSVNGHAMGEAFVTKDVPELKVEAVGTARLKRVDIVRDGTCVKTITPEGIAASLTWRDDEGIAGTHYYFVRVVQEETPHQKRVTLPRNRGLSVQGPWKARVTIAPDSGAPPGPFEIEGEPGGAIAWSSPVWVTRESTSQESAPRPRGAPVSRR